MSLLSESDSLKKALLQPTDMFQSYSLSPSFNILYFLGLSFSLIYAVVINNPPPPTQT